VIDRSLRIFSCMIRRSIHGWKGLSPGAKADHRVYSHAFFINNPGPLRKRIVQDFLKTIKRKRTRVSLSGRAGSGSGCCKQCSYEVKYRIIPVPYSELKKKPVCLRGKTKFREETSLLYRISDVPVSDQRLSQEEDEYI